MKSFKENFRKNFSRFVVTVSIVVVVALSVVLLWDVSKPKGVEIVPGDPLENLDLRGEETDKPGNLCSEVINGEKTEVTPCSDTDSESIVVSSFVESFDRETVFG